jgi:hypothetical protein
MLGISFLGSIRVSEFPPVEVLINPTTRGLSVTNKFQTEGGSSTHCSHQCHQTVSESRACVEYICIARSDVISDIVGGISESRFEFDKVNRASDLLIC